MSRLVATAYGLAAILAASAAVGAEASRYDDAPFCSKALATEDGKALSAADHRRCVIAIASTYLDFEQNTLPPDQLLVADDVAKRNHGKPAEHKPGTGDWIRGRTVQHVIGAIRNRVWTVDHNVAWVAYDGYLKDDMSKPGFYIVERFIIENGLIREIMTPAGQPSSQNPVTALPPGSH
jgi:hypothetical protein